MVKPFASAGVAKINRGTRPKVSLMSGLREAIARMPARYSIHDHVGSKDSKDVVVRDKDRLKAHIDTLIEQYGCSGTIAAGGTVERRREPPHEAI
jgi:hypothetical protein